MSRYDPLYAAIAKLETNHKDPEMVEADPILGFPFKTMYRSQADVLKRMYTDAKTHDNLMKTVQKDKRTAFTCCISSHTGWGKTPVFLSMTRGCASIVIEPRKFLQEQCSSGYFKDFVLYGRSGYTCPLAIVHDARYATASTGTAAAAPCLLKVECDRTAYHETCPDANNTCLNDACKVFPKGDGYQKYPCKDCLYIEAQKEAQDVLSNNGVVICNFGNFWNLLRGADLVVIDESDLFFRQISAPIKLKYSNPKKHGDDDIKVLMNREVEGLNKDKKSGDAGFRYKVQTALYNASFLMLYHDLCFKYQRKDAIYVEVDPRNVNILAKKVFHGKNLVIVSATPGLFDAPVYAGQIHQRCGIYFAPVGNLTSKSLRENPYLMSRAAKAIEEISTHMDCVYDAEKVIIFCGNLGTHAASLYNILGEQDCILHQSGQLSESLERYKQSSKKYFLVAGAEWGLDAGFCKLQFLLKHPFPNLDERARTLQRVMGPDFSAYYENEARMRVTQTFGRNVRGFNDFGITVCLDSKTHDDYKKNRNCYPQWLQSRVDEKVY